MAAWRRAGTLQRQGRGDRGAALAHQRSVASGQMTHVGEEVGRRLRRSRQRPEAAARIGEVELVGRDGIAWSDRRHPAASRTAHHQRLDPALPRQAAGCPLDPRRIAGAERRAYRGVIGKALRRPLCSEGVVAVHREGSV